MAIFSWYSRCFLGFRAKIRLVITSQHMLLWISHESLPAFKHFRYKRQHTPVSLSPWEGGDPLHINPLHGDTVRFLSWFPQDSLQRRLQSHQTQHQLFQCPNEMQCHLLFNAVSGVVSSRCSAVVDVQPPWRTATSRTAKLFNQHNDIVHKPRKENFVLLHICNLELLLKSEEF